MRVPVWTPTASCSTLDETVRFQSTKLLTQATLFGAVLLRGFPPQALSALDLPRDDFRYVGGAAPRTRVASTVSTANDAPSFAEIPFHHELGQSRAMPSFLLFRCVTPATSGGATCVVDSRDLATWVARTYPETSARLDDGVRYRRVLSEEDDPTSPIGRGWKSTFRAATKAQAERVMRDARMAWEWRDGDDGTTTLWTETDALPAWRHHPRTGALSFCNSIVAAHVGWTDARNPASEPSVVFADGAPVPDAFARAVARRAWNERYDCQWRTNDVLVVDNHACMHARQPFEGERVLHVRMLA